MHPSAILPITNMSAYLTKPAIIQAAKNNAYYIGRLQQHLADFDKDLAEWKSSGEWKKDYKTWGAACEIALNMSQRHANRLISEHEQSSKDKSVQTGHPCPAEPDTDKAHESEMRMALPDPTDEIERPSVHAGPAPEPEPVAAPKAVPERTRAAPTEGGKPVYALAVWKDLLDFYGHALNRLSDANRAVPDPKLYQTMEAQTKDLMNKSRAWHERAKK
jgi:hypothetical protein